MRHPSIIILSLTSSFLLMVGSSTAAVLTGIGDGSSHVKSFVTQAGAIYHSYFAYPGFNGGVRVATGDVNGDGVPDIITGTAATSSHVNVFSGVDLATIRSFLAFPQAITGGVYVAAGDINGDGRDEIIVGTGVGGGPRVKIFDGATNNVLNEFSAYADSFLGGVRVAAGDVNNDGKADIITGTASITTNVKVFSGANYAQLQSFLAFGPNLTGGVHVAAGRFNSDGEADLVVGTGEGIAAQVRVYNGVNNAILHDFFAYGVNYTGGVRVAAGDVNGDGTADIITGAGTNSGHVKAFSGSNLNLLSSYFAYEGGVAGGVYVAAVNKSCPADIAPIPFGDGKVSVQDLLAVINNWGACGNEFCPADIAPGGGDNAVGVADLLAIITAWGDCP